MKVTLVLFGLTVLMWIYQTFFYSKKSELNFRIISNEEILTVKENLPELISASEENYLKEPIDNVSDSLIYIKKLLFDKGSFLTLKLLVIHKQDEKPELKARGKISGINRIKVLTGDSLIQKTDTRFILLLIASFLFLYILFASNFISFKDKVKTQIEYIEEVQSNSPRIPRIDPLNPKNIDDSDKFDNGLYNIYQVIDNITQEQNVEIRIDQAIKFSKAANDKKYWASFSEQERIEVIELGCSNVGIGSLDVFIYDGSNELVARETTLLQIVDGGGFCI